MAENAVVGKNAVVGERPEEALDREKWGIAVIGDGITVGKGARVKAKAMVEADIAEVK